MHGVRAVVRLEATIDSRIMDSGSTPIDGGLQEAANCKDGDESNKSMFEPRNGSERLPPQKPANRLAPSAYRKPSGSNCNLEPGGLQN